MPRRKRSTWGCVQRMAPGVWRLRWWDDTPEGRKRRSETVYGTRKEADRRLAEIRVAVKVEDASPTVGQVFERFVRPQYLDDMKAGKKKPNTIEDYLRTWDNCTSERWAGVPVTQARPYDVQEWLLTLSNSTARKSLTVLRAVSSKSVFLGLLDHDPLKMDFRLPDKATQDRTVPDLAGLDEVWGLCRGQWVEPVFLLCAHAGLRVGEACGMRVADLTWDGDAAVVPVRQQITPKALVEAPKYKSYRTVALPAPWGARLHEIVDGLRPGAVWVMDDGASDLDAPPSRSRLYYQWSRIVRGTPYSSFTLRKMRPAFETYMHWEWHVPLDMVSKMLGHKGTAVTAEHYDRPGDDALVGTILQAARDNGLETS